MPVRHRHRLGDYLMRDDESGEVRYRSELIKRWDGLWVQRKGYETRQPQEFVRAKKDPYSLRHVRPDELVALPYTGLEVTIGESTVPFPPNNAAAHLFDFGLGQMRVGFSWIVR